MPAEGLRKDFGVADIYKCFSNIQRLPNEILSACTPSLLSAIYPFSPFSYQRRLLTSVSNTLLTPISIYPSPLSAVYSSLPSIPLVPVSYAEEQTFIELQIRHTSGIPPGAIEGWSGGLALNVGLLSPPKSRPKVREGLSAEGLRKDETLACGRIAEGVPKRGKCQSAEGLRKVIFRTHSLRSSVEGFCDTAEGWRKHFSRVEPTLGWPICLWARPRNLVVVTS